MRITQAKPEQLLGLALFNSFPPEGLTELVSTCTLKVYEEGEILFFEGDPAEGVLLVLTGRTVLFRGSELGRELVLSRLGRGEVINLVPALLAEQPRWQACARASGHLEVLNIPLPALRGLMNANNTFTQSLLRMLADRLDRAMDLASSMSLKSTRARLAAFLICQADGLGTQPNPTQNDIAAEIGTVREVVARLLKDFEMAGWLKRDRQRIRLRDRAALERVARDQDQTSPM